MCLGYITPLSGSNSIIVLMRAVTVGHIANVLYNAGDLGIDWSLILMDLRWESVCCIHLGQDREQWWAALNEAMNF
jgi:hypothetical protein